MQKYTDTVIKDGKPIQGLTINVVNYPAGTPATIYSSTGSVVASVQTDANGRFEFYALSGHYSFTVSGAGINPYTLNDIVLFDPTDQAAAAGIGATSGTVQSVLNTKAPLASPVFTGAVTSTKQGSKADLGYKINGNGAWNQPNLVGHWYTGSQDAAALRVPSAGDTQTSGIDVYADGTTVFNGPSIERARLDAAGNWLVGQSSGSYHTILKSTTENTGNAVAYIGSPSGGGVSVFAVSGTGANAANAAVKIGKDSLSGRSLNAGGTINASGADYAEYMTKEKDTGAITAGDIIGITAAGTVTDKWVDSVSFLIKSTNPSFVGGDVWGTSGAIGQEPPVEPVFEIPPYTGFPQPSNTPPTQPLGANVTAAEQAAYGVALAQYQADLTRFDHEWTAYVTEVVAQRDQFETVTMGEYRTALAAFQATLEAARQRVDRIAFCGQVPVNILGAKPGQYVVPVRVGDGIGGQMVNDADITFPQYRLAVGIVQNIFSDGRANVRVKVV